MAPGAITKAPGALSRPSERFWGADGLTRSPGDLWLSHRRAHIGAGLVSARSTLGSLWKARRGRPARSSRTPRSRPGNHRSGSRATHPANQASKAGGGGSTPTAGHAPTPAPWVRAPRAQSAWTERRWPAAINTRARSASRTRPGPAPTRRWAARPTERLALLRRHQAASPSSPSRWRAPAAPPSRCQSPGP